MKKIIFGIFLCLALFWGIPNPVYAAEIDYSSNLPDEASKHYYFIYQTSDGECWLFCSEYPICYTTNGYLSSYILDGNGVVYDFKGGVKYLFDDGLGVWVDRSVVSVLAFDKDTSFGLASNHDILSCSNGGSFIDPYGEPYGVFFSPPLPTPIPTPTPVVLTELAGIAQEAKPAGVMKQVVRMIPIVMAASVGYLGLRKALATLQKVLFRA